MNQVQLDGRLAKDVEVKMTKSGKSWASFTIATNETYTVNGETKDLTSFINCVAWGALADNIANLKKGDRVVATGRINVRSYEVNGAKRYATEVVCNFVAGQPKAQSNGNFERMADNNTQEEIPF